MSRIETKEEFSTRIYQTGIISGYKSRASVDIIPIRFVLLKLYADYNPEIHEYVAEAGLPILVRMKTLKLRFSREWAIGDEKTTRRDLQAMGLDEDKHLSIVEQIMEMLPSAVPDKGIKVQIIHAIYRDTEATLHLHSEDLYYRAKLIPAAESFIQALEEVRSPPLELECPICKEMFAQKKGTSITKLPCSHYYHRDCVVPWLQINHLCPTCRHPSC
ncbi:hypothetical protein ACLB2K_061438 [Fragaria x ananassa]